MKRFFAYLNPLFFAVLTIGGANAEEVPAGTVMTIRLIDAVDSRIDGEGSTFRATLDEPLPVLSGAQIPRGAEVKVKIAKLDEGCCLVSKVSVALVAASILHQGRWHDLSTSQVVTSSKSRLRRSSVIVGGAAAVGAMAGGLMAGGTGAVVGAMSGGGVGTAYQTFRKGVAVRVPSESRLTFTLAYPFVF